MPPFDVCFGAFFDVSSPTGGTLVHELVSDSINPWLAKFRGLSKPGLKQSVRTYGFVRTLNLAGAPLYGLLDCFVVTVFR